MQEMQVMQGLIFWSGRSPGVGNGNLLQCSCLENSMDRGAWQATGNGATKIATEHAHMLTNHNSSSFLPSLSLIKC